MKNNKYYIIMCDMVFPVMAPDGGIWADHETEEYDGYTYDNKEEAEEKLARARELNPNMMIWLSEKED